MLTFVVANVCICVTDYWQFVSLLAISTFKHNPIHSADILMINLTLHIPKWLFLKNPSLHGVTWWCLKIILQYEGIFPLKRKGILELSKIFVAVIAPFHLE